MRSGFNSPAYGIWPYIKEVLYGLIPYNNQMAKESTSAERVDLRLPRALKERVRKIAAQSGRSMSDFMVAAVLEKVDEAEASIERWELSAEDSLLVMSLLTQRRDLPGLDELLALTDPERARIARTV